ncbi:MAG: hypothetical protein AB7O97_16490 [Planctomycetota bacterium]
MPTGAARVTVYDQDLHWFGPVLEEWTKMIARYSQRVTNTPGNPDDPDAAYWHCEKTLVSMLHAAAWRRDCPAIVEVHSGADVAIERDAGTTSRYGLLDLYVMSEDGERHLFLEAKLEHRRHLDRASATQVADAQWRETRTQLSEWRRRVQPYASFPAQSCWLSALFLGPRLPQRTEFAPPVFGARLDDGSPVALECWAPATGPAPGQAVPHDRQAAEWAPGVLLLARTECFRAD